MRLFLWFRIFFNCRFYYPVFAIMFLDFGLSKEQFAYLNFAWAIMIVLLEVPSGALADQIGRKKLLVLSGVLMVFEMGLLCLMPVIVRGDYATTAEGQATYHTAVGVLFLVFMLNRLLSGAAEAAASGADEALAYDSLPLESRQTAWTHWMKKLIVWQALAFMVVTLVGAAVYDPDVMNTVAGFFGLETNLEQRHTVKFPIYLNLGMAFIALALTLKFHEVHEAEPSLHIWDAIRKSFRRTWRTGRWILHTPAALFLILIGLFYDSLVRLYYTVGSIYLRLLHFEEAAFGLIGVAGSLTGIAAASLAHHLVHHRRPTFNFGLLTLLIFIGIGSLAHPFIPYWGVIFIAPLWVAMRLLHFFISHYLNRVTDSEHRATVLSFKSLSMNLAYGGVMLLYGWQDRYLTHKLEPENYGVLDEAGRTQVELTVFAAAIEWWWVYFAFVVTGIIAFRIFKLKKSVNEMLESYA